MPPYGFARIEKPFFATSIRGGITWPMTMKRRVTFPARPHETVARARPVAVPRPTCQRQVARPFVAGCDARPFWRAPFA